SQYIDLDPKLFAEKAAKAKDDDQDEELAKKVEREVGESIAALKITGIDAYKENWRVYSGNSLFSHTLGIVGYDSGNKVAGRYGLERNYENVLYRTGQKESVNFFAELFGGVQNGVFSGSDKEGDIVTSLDPTLGSYLEEILSDTKDLWGSDSIGGIIMDPHTGAIYAMSALPAFNPNELSSVKNPKIFSNPLVEDVYEMGSIIKPLTMAAGIDSKVITKNSMYDDTGFLMLDEKKISNFDGRARGRVSMQEVLSQSLNIGAAYIALKLGNEEFRRYFTSFGIGEKTGIDQPNEARGIVDNLSSKRQIEHATASYGQGIAMSPISTIRALSVIANGGKLVQPHLVKEINYIDGTVKMIASEPGLQVIQKETSDDVTNMLIEVVDKAIAKAHPDIKMEHYSIAAKTGTAQIANHGNGGYYSDRYLHSFFGYFPAYNPRFIVFLYQINPKGAQYASETLVDPFVDLAKFIINYYEISPDR
ncbi:MAG: penicillin-binding protein 2, partial [Patescibacteria group bacterium]